MNPLLSLSFSGSGPLTADAEPMAQQSGGVMDEAGKATNFGRLLDQSAELQISGRQSIAAFTISGKSKRMASMEGLPAGRPEITLPPVTPPSAELLLADDNDAGALLGFLDIASQTRLHLTSDTTDKAQLNIVNQPGVVIGDAAASSENTAADDEPSAEGRTANAITLMSGASKPGKEGWFVSPVPATPVATETVARAETDLATAKRSQSVMANGSVMALAAMNITSKGEASQDNTSQSTKQSDNIAATLTQAASSAQNSEAEPAAQLPEALTENANLATSAKAISATLADLNTPETDAVPRAMAADINADTLSSETVIAETRAASAEKMAQIKPDSALNPVAAVLKEGVTFQHSEALSGTVAASDVLKAAGPQAAATIFDTTATAHTATDENKSANSAASAALMAESLSAKQQRIALADSGSQQKQALAAESDTSGQMIKGDAGMMAQGARADSSLNGFGSIFGAASHNQTETAFARLDAANTAIARHAASQASTQSVNKSVTEQLKQVNLLAQNAAGQLNERINLMLRQNIQVAEIRLDPAELGQMQIRVNLQQEQASVQFIVQQQHAKELLEQQMPRLRDMLQQQGIQLGEGQVQQQRQGDNQAGSRRDGHAGNGHAGNEQTIEEQATTVQLDVKLSERIVDYYA